MEIYFLRMARFGIAALVNVAMAVLFLQNLTVKKAIGLLSVDHFYLHVHVFEQTKSFILLGNKILFACQYKFIFRIKLNPSIASV